MHYEEHRVTPFLHQGLFFFFSKCYLLAVPLRFEKIFTVIVDVLGDMVQAQNNYL